MGWINFWVKELQNSSHGMNFTNASVSEWNMFSCTCSQEELGFATFRLSNSSLGSKNSSLGPSALGMNFFSLGMNYSLQVAKPNSPFRQCTKLYNCFVMKLLLLHVASEKQEFLWSICFELCLICLLILPLSSPHWKQLMLFFRPISAVW